MLPKILAPAPITTPLPMVGCRFSFSLPAQSFRLKEHSIRNYIYRIFEKLGVSSRVELILICV